MTAANTAKRQEGIIVDDSFQFIHHVQPDLITRPLVPDAGESTCKSGRVAVSPVACLGTMFRSSEPANPAAQLSMQSTINDNLEARIAYLENALAFQDI